MKKVYLSALFFLAVASGNLYSQQLAFPGAEGFGRFAKGVRGGANPEVYHVTNLNDSGEGSLRDAVASPKNGGSNNGQGRIVVFDVSGVINIGARIVFGSNITVAGQTAPGEGVVVYGNGVSFSGASDVIVRHMRFRMGTKGDNGKDAAGVANGTNMIFDHLSVTWGLDENFSINPDNKGDLYNFTIQNSIIGQGLQTHSCGGLIQTDGGVTLFRNLYIDNKTRNPKVKGLNQYVNNVVYNWGSGGCYILGDSAGDSWATIEDNYFIKGPTGGTNAFTRATPTFQVYQKGNMIDYNQNGLLDGRDATEEDFRRSETITVTFVPSYDDFQGAPQRHPEILSATSAKEAYDWVVNHVGASLPARDLVDQYLINELTSLGKSGALISGESNLGLENNVGNIFRGIQLLDTDGDGIPDYWEEENGLDKNNPEDALQIADNGYLNIENYINSIVEPRPFVKYPTKFQLWGVHHDGVELSWKNTESNSDKIILSVSKDKEFGEEELVEIEGNLEKHKHLLSEGGTFYFRLKTIKDGIESDFSNVVYVNFVIVDNIQENEVLGNFEAFPVPFIDEISFVNGFIEYVIDEMEVKIMDMAGKVVVSTRVKLENNKLCIKGLNDLAKGYYICTISVGNESKTLKLVK